MSKEVNNFITCVTSFISPLLLIQDIRIEFVSGGLVSSSQNLTTTFAEVVNNGTDYEFSVLVNIFNSFDSFK